MSEPSVDDPLAWYALDVARFRLESRALTTPWRFVRDTDGRYVWEGGELFRRWRHRETERRSARLIYPYGYPSRFIEARLDPAPPEELWGAYGAHVNVDGSACYITADGWRAQDTVVEALDLLNDWWWNYFWVFERNAADAWPGRGKVDV